MQMRFFGDSYDVVKRFLLRTIAPNASWAAFPMFTDTVTATDVSAFEAFLGVRVVSPTPFSASTDRAAHLVAQADHTHVFLDPDIGVKLRPSTSVDAMKYIFGPELIALCGSNRDRLLVVFDQSVPRGRERQALAQKLSYFEERNVYGFGYVSHACFLILSGAANMCDGARRNLVTAHLPQNRLVRASDA